MADFIKELESFFTDLWHYCYVFLRNLWDKDVDEELIVKNS